MDKDDFIASERAGDNERRRRFLAGEQSNEEEQPKNRYRYISTKNEIVNRGIGGIFAAKDKVGEKAHNFKEKVTSRETYTTPLKNAGSKIYNTNYSDIQAGIEARRHEKEDRRVAREADEIEHKLHSYKLRQVKKNAADYDDNLANRRNAKIYELQLYIKQQSASPHGMSRDQLISYVRSIQAQEQVGVTPAGKPQYLLEESDVNRLITLIKTTKNSRYAQEVVEERQRKALDAKAVAEASNGKRKGIAGKLDNMNFKILEDGNNPFSVSGEQSSPINYSGLDYYFGGANRIPEDTESISNVHPLKQYADSLLVKPATDEQLFVQQKPVSKPKPNNSGDMLTNFDVNSMFMKPSAPIKKGGKKDSSVHPAFDSHLFDDLYSKPKGKIKKKGSGWF